MAGHLSQEEIAKLADSLFPTLWGELRLSAEIAAHGERAQPMLVRHLDGTPAYWLVPLAAQDRLAGFIRLGLAGGLLAYGRYGQAQRLDQLPPLSYLSQQGAERSIRNEYGHLYPEIDTPQLVQDGPTSRTAWMAHGTTAEDQTELLFWVFGTCYSRAADEKPQYGML